MTDYIRWQKSSLEEALAGRIGKVRLRPLSQGEIINVKPLFLERAFVQDFKRGAKRHNRNDLIFDRT